MYLLWPLPLGVQSTPSESVQSLKDGGWCIQPGYYSVLSCPLGPGIDYSRSELPCWEKCFAEVTSVSLAVSEGHVSSASSFFSTSPHSIHVFVLLRRPQARTNTIRIKGIFTKFNPVHKTLRSLQKHLKPFGLKLRRIYVELFFFYPHKVRDFSFFLKWSCADMVYRTVFVTLQ